MSKYAAITILVHVDDNHGRDIPNEWFSGLPDKGSYYAADVVDMDKPDDLHVTLYSAYMAQARKIRQDGFPV